MSNVTLKRIPLHACLLLAYAHTYSLNYQTALNYLFFIYYFTYIEPDETTHALCRWFLTGVKSWCRLVLSVRPSFVCPSGVQPSSSRWSVHSTLHPSVRPSIRLSINSSSSVRRPSAPFICPSVIHPSIRVINPSIHLSFVCSLSVRLSIGLSVHLSIVCSSSAYQLSIVRPSVRPSAVRLSVRPSVRPSVLLH